MRSGSLDYRPLCVKGNTGGRQNPSNSLFSVEVEGKKAASLCTLAGILVFTPPPDLPFPRYCLVLFPGEPTGEGRARSLLITPP